jgi:DNA polymerase elongation subunit (family B)
MSYVDATYDRDRDRIHVVERVNGKRIIVEYAPKHEFYYDDPVGKYISIYGTPVSRIKTRNKGEFRREVALYKNTPTYESDINVINKCLEENYKNINSPKLHTAFFDIETDFHPEKGFSPPSDPFNKVTAISIYLDWSKQLICLAIPPKAMSMESANKIADEFDNTIMFEKEADMLSAFLDLIDDADILSGWNSEGFDIPYLVNRITRVLSKNDTRRFCLWDLLPKKKKFERYGAEQESFITIGRVHLDYMQLYIKYTYQEMHSYALDAIAEYELGDKKVAYEGTLDHLYNHDFKKFIDYSRQDTLLLAKLDEKLKFLELANEVAHANTVLLPPTMGAVAVTEQAIINEAHERGFVVPDKVRNNNENVQAAGAYVAHPKKGIHKWIGSVDINSLYPSVIRALNMAPETIIGQFRPDETDKMIKSKMIDQRRDNGKMYKGSSFAGAWEGLFGTLEYTAVMEQKPGVMITVDWTNGDSTTHTAYELHQVIFASGSNWTLSANGTIFSLEREGVIPGLLERWSAERKEMQAKKRNAETPEDIAFWDKRQLVKKIGLNSLYGAILNQHCRFFDKRIGQSTTLTGRAIAKHMDAYINECLTGEYDHIGKCIIYGDTDSAYFSAWPVMEEAVKNGAEWNKDIATALYENIAEQINNSFPTYMETSHNVPTAKGEIIKCGREITGISGLFIKKKRYAIMVYDNEGTRYDTDDNAGKVKAMGLDLKRSDTPVIVQDFLKEILEATLLDKSQDEIIEMIITFKKEFRDMSSWKKGSPKRVNNLSKYAAIMKNEIEEKRKGNKVPMIPGHVRAAVNWNNLRLMHSDNYSMKIIDGMKTVVCKLKNNPLGITSIGIPTDEHNIPEWYKELPFDDRLMESTIVDKKIENLLGALKWDLVNRTNINSTFQQLFSFT